MDYPLYLPGQAPTVLHVEGRRRLALPFDHREPFPLPTLFCFAQISHSGDRTWAVFTFDDDGYPVFPEK